MRFWISYTKARKGSFHEKHQPDSLFYHALLLDPAEERGDDCSLYFFCIGRLVGGVSRALGAFGSWRMDAVDLVDAVCAYPSSLDSRCLPCHIDFYYGAVLSPSCTRHSQPTGH